MASTSVSWQIGSMREGDSRSVLRANISHITPLDTQTLLEELQAMNLVMEVAINSNTLYLRLDIGDSSSKIAPQFWKGFDTA